VNTGGVRIRARVILRSGNKLVRRYRREEPVLSAPVGQDRRIGSGQFTLTADHAAATAACSVLLAP
jgi:hypothetical protein